MQRRALSLPEIGLIAGTRTVLGAGLGLLLADRMSRDVRRGVGWALFAVGAITTVPIAAQLLFGEKRGTLLEYEEDLAVTDESLAPEA